MSRERERAATVRERFPSPSPEAALKRAALVVGGWHFPHGFFAGANRQQTPGWLVDSYVVAHRRLPEVVNPPLASDLDEMLYSGVPSEREGWAIDYAPNIAGDWCFLNQWLERHDYRDYDAILFCHDDTLWRHERALLAFLDHPGDWLLLTNGTCPNAPAGHVRGSFEVFRRELLDMLGGKIPMPPLALNREGKTDTPPEFEALAPWNEIGEPLRHWLCDNCLVSRVAHMSPHYRVSEHVIEGERGLISSEVAAPWSFRAGLEKWPIRWC